MNQNNHNIPIMYACAYLEGLVFYAPIAALYRTSVGISVFQITLIESISLGLMLALELPWGILAERIGYRHTRIICALLAVLAKAVFWKADTFAMFLAERILIAIVFSGLSGVDSSILYLSCRKDQSSHSVFSRYFGFGTAGLLSASAVYTLFLQNQYRQAAFWSLIAYALSALLCFFLSEVHDSSQHAVSIHAFTGLLKKTLHSSELMCFLCAAALFNETHQTITVFLGQLKYSACGISQTGIGISHILLTAAGLLSAGSAFFAYKTGERKAVWICLLSGFSACMVLAFTGNGLASIAMVLLLRIAHALFEPLQNELQNRAVTAEDRATALSIQSLIMDSIGIFTNLLFGSLADLNLSLAFSAGALFCLSALFLYHHSQKKSGTMSASV